MQTGIRLLADPTGIQKLRLSQWMGCARAVWNAKCDEHRYMSAQARLHGPGLGMVVDFVRYKSARAGKLLLLVDPKNTSRECASCRHVHEDNRRTQALFECTACGHRDNADRNASTVIGKRAVELVLDSGTELSERGVLRKPQPAGTGRGAEGKTQGAAKSAPCALGDEASKKKGRAGFLKEAA